MNKIPRKDLVYISIQLILFIVYLIPVISFKINIHPFLQQLFLVISVIGFSIVVICIIQLNKSLTPFPTPKENGVLNTSGLYKYVRYPIYAGIIIFTIFFGLYNLSQFKISIGILLFILFYFKSNYEEKLLVDKYKNYKDYLKNTKKFIPFII